MHEKFIRNMDSDDKNIRSVAGFVFKTRHFNNLTIELARKTPGLEKINNIV